MFFFLHYGFVFPRQLFARLHTSSSHIHVISSRAFMLHFIATTGYLCCTGNLCCTSFPPPIVHAAHYFHCLWRLVLFTNAKSLSIYRRIERRTSSGIGRGTSCIGGGTPSGIGGGTPCCIGRGTSGIGGGTPSGIGRDMVLFT